MLSVAAILLLVGSSQISLAEAKRQRGTFRIGGTADAGRSQYVSKFGFGIGRGRFDLDLKLKSGSLQRNANLMVHAYVDDDWSRASSTSPCEREEQNLARIHMNTWVDRNASNWEGVSGFLTQTLRSHIWYVAVVDCDIINGFRNETVELEYDFHAIQADQSEFGVEARHAPYTQGVGLLGFLVILRRMGCRCRAIRESAGALHPVILALAIAATLQCASQVAHMLHLMRYSTDGEGFWLLDVLAEVFFMASQVAHTMLLLAIARGYTLLPGKSSERDLAQLGFIASLAAHAALVSFGKMREGTSSQQHHNNDGLLGWAIVSIQVFLLLFFVYSANSTRLRGGYRLENFMRSFQLAGSLYFVAYPIVFVVAQLFAPYLRQPVIHVGTLFMQASIDVWLTNLFLSRGAYFKASTLSSSILPGGGSCFGAIGLGKDD
eukprot:TRINITY_DN76392_c0_g1_i1.p1 TRINITY_DN76392_c0_g1~~TRINITY_DN76392_c0_g1_i1.p1  ORF type:complete len:435 (+),score=47.64 TRINITY_DN76392_c0_g1_i1:47-1351(+)